MNIFDFGEVFKNVKQLLIEGLLTEFNFSHIERSDSADCITGVDDGGCFPLSFGKDNVDKLNSSRNNLDVFEIVAHVFVNVEN